MSLSNLPSDPVMLLGMVNTRLRDNYANLEDLCEDMDLDIDELVKKLEENGYKYFPEINQFR